MSPFYTVTGVTVRLRNTSDGTTTINGVNNYFGAGVGAYAQFEGTFTITASKNFEVQYLCNTAVATNGLGVAMTGGAASEIYTQITINKTA